MQDVEVRIDGLPFVTPADWQQAQATPETDLPKLDESKSKPVFPSRGNPEVGARRELAFQLARDRMYQEGIKLADILASVIPGTSHFELRYVVWDGSRREWIAVPVRQEVRPVGIPSELASRLTGWGTKQDYEELTQLFKGSGTGSESRGA